MPEPTKPTMFAPGPAKKPDSILQPLGKVGVPVTEPDTTPVKVAPVKLAPDTFAPVSTALAKFAFARLALVKFAPGPTR